MNEQMKRQMLDNYLKQQQQQSVQTFTPSVVSAQVRAHTDNQESFEAKGETAIVAYDSLPENISLEEFKNYVKKWLEYDNFIKKAKEVIKEKKKLRDDLTKIVTKFMCKYNIEDLNTKEGRIRCKTTVVKAPVSQKVVKQRITDYFKDDYQRNEVLHKIYEEREQVEKVSLRRLKIT